MDSIDICTSGSFHRQERINIEDSSFSLVHVCDFRKACFLSLKTDVRSQSGGCKCRYSKFNLNSMHFFQMIAKIPPQNTTPCVSQRSCQKNTDKENLLSLKSKTSVRLHHYLQKGER